MKKEEGGKMRGGRHLGHVGDGMEVEWGQCCHLRDTCAEKTDTQDQLLDAEREETFA